MKKRTVPDVEQDSNANPVISRSASVMDLSSITNLKFIWNNAITTVFVKTVFSIYLLS